MTYGGKKTCGKVLTGVYNLWDLPKVQRGTYKCKKIRVLVLFRQ